MRLTFPGIRWRIVIFAAVLTIVLSILFPFRMLLRPMLFLGGPKTVHVYDGFESAKLSSHWMKLKMVPGSFVSQSQVVRAGYRAGEITLHSGDLHEDASDCCAANERDELMERWRYFSHFHRRYRYSFSLYLPPDFPVVPIRLVIAQWKQLCEWRGCRPDSPILAIRYQAGELFITRQDEHDIQTLYSTKQELRGRWLDFQFETNFSPRADGAIDAWLNGAPICHYRGPTVYQPQFGYPSDGLIYFKTGLYRNEMSQPMTIFVDEYRKDELER